jgi:hypothetical protein
VALRHGVFLLPIVVSVAAAQQADPSGPCTPILAADSRPPGARPISWTEPAAVTAALTGTWDLVLMNTVGRPEPALYRTVRLRLAPPESTARPRVIGLRMVGTVLSPSPLGGRSSAVAAADPGVGNAGRTLYLSGMGVTDANGDFLHPTGVSPEAFWGTWQLSSGIEMLATRDSTGAWVPLEAPRGFFCARRARS